LRLVEALIHAFNYTRYLALSVVMTPLWFILFRPKSIVVYTCVFGGRDKLKDPMPFPFQGRFVDLVCFTDDDSVVSRKWQVRKVDIGGRSPALATRYYKILPHEVFPEYRYSIWEDATHTLRADPRWLVFRFLRKSALAVFSHPWRSCVYKEAEKCLEYGLDDADVIRSQMKRYREEGYPENNGLATCTVMLRRHNDTEVRELMGTWYDDVKNASSRDQLSFDHACWKKGFSYAKIRGQVYRNPYFAYEPHADAGATRRAP